MIRVYRKSKIQYLKILEYLHLSFDNWPSIQYKFWVSLVLWNHNNGEHCWLGNGPEDDHRHPPQRGQVTGGHYWKVWLFTECCIKVNQMQSWLEGRNWVGKCAQAKGNDHKLENTVKQSWFKHLGELHKEWTEAGVLQPAQLGTCPHCPCCYCAWLASKLAWPEPHRESMGYCQ